MYCLKITKALRVKTGGEVLTLPAGRCLEVVSTTMVGWSVVIDETGEHLGFQRGDPRVVEATPEDLANEP